MDGEDEGDLRQGICAHPLDGPRHPLHGHAPTLAAVDGHQHLGAGPAEGLGQAGLQRRRRHGGGGQQGVDDRVAGHEQVLSGDALGPQRLAAAAVGGRVVDQGQAVGEAAVDLLRVGAVDVVGAQPGFDVGDRDHPVEGGQSGGEGGGGVAVHQHDVGLDAPRAAGRCP